MVVKIIILPFIMMLIFIGHAQAQNVQGPVFLPVIQKSPHSFIERSNWRRFDNGRYTGLTSTEIRATILPESNQDPAGDSFLYNGIYFLIQNTVRDMRQNDNQLRNTKGRLQARIPGRVCIEAV